MKDESKILDWRSTGRRKARRALYQARVSYECIGHRLPNGSRKQCGKTSIEPPKDAPKYFDELWPEEHRVLKYQLQADHADKDYENNDLDNIDWKCQPCHKKDDSSTGVGVPQESRNYW